MQGPLESLWPAILRFPRVPVPVCRDTLKSPDTFKANYGPTLGVPVDGAKHVERPLMPAMASAWVARKITKTLHHVNGACAGGT